MRRYHYLSPPVCRVMIASSGVCPPPDPAEAAPQPAPQPLANVPAALVLKGLKVGRNRKHRRAIVVGMSKQAAAKK